MADIEEMHEHAAHGAADGRMAPVTLSMAVLAVLVAVVSLMGSRIHADEMLAQTRATDQWSEYQAQVIRERSYQVFLDQMSVFPVQDSSQAEQLKEKYSNEVNRYDGQTKAIQTQAYVTEADVKALEHRSNYFDFAEVLLEAGIVICSITLLTERRHYWYFGLFSAALGTVIAVIGLFVH